MPREKPPKITKDGLPDGRGHGQGSKATRFSAYDNRPRPGRPTGARDLKTIVAAIRNLPVAKDGKRRVIAQEAILRAQVKKALAGDTRAAQFVQSQIDRFEQPVVNPDLTGQLLAEDAEILAATLARGGLVSTQEPDDE